MEFYEVDQRKMKLIYDLQAQQPRKNLRGTESWRIFWSDFPIVMGTYNSIQKGKLFRILANHKKRRGVVCIHQIRLTIDIANCVDTSQSFVFKVAEIRPCSCGYREFILCKLVD